LWGCHSKALTENNAVDLVFPFLFLLVRGSFIKTSKLKKLPQPSYYIHCFLPILRTYGWN
jgi:hypothetical protein